jgi:hypothetical protein
MLLNKNKHICLKLFLTFIVSLLIATILLINLSKKCSNLYFVSVSKLNEHIPSKKLCNQILQHKNLFKGIYVYDKDYSIEFLSKKTKCFYKNWINYNENCQNFYNKFFNEVSAILNLMKKIKDNDIIIYVDPGHCICKNFKKDIKNHITSMRHNNYDMSVNSLDMSGSERYISKDFSLFSNLFKIPEDKKSIGMIEPDIQIIIKNKKTLNHFEKLLDTLIDNCDLLLNKADDTSKEKRCKILFSLFTKKNPLGLKLDCSDNKLDLIFLKEEKIIDSSKHFNAYIEKNERTQFVKPD